MRERRDPEDLRTTLVRWIADRVQESGTSGAVFGLSGGVDSAVVCGLAAEALGPERCLGVILPIESAPEDARLGLEAAETFGVPSERVDLGEAFASLHDALERARGERTTGDPGSARLARMNLKPRLRMASLYYFANHLDRLVIGTGNAAEFAVGYFTKYGDGGADIFPLGELVKAEVWALARCLGVPSAIVERAPTAGLAPGQTDEGELGLGYDALDAYLLRGTSGDEATDARIRALVQGSAHKRDSPPIAPLD